MFQWESWNLAPVRFYKRGRGAGLTAITSRVRLCKRGRGHGLNVLTSHEVCADVSMRSPGDVTISLHLKS